MSIAQPSEPNERSIYEENRRLRERIADLERESARSPYPPTPTSLLNHLMNNAPIGVGFLDPDFRYLAVNRHLADMNGLTPEEHIGRTVDEVVPFVAAQARKAFERVVETRRPLFDQEFSGESAKQPGQSGYWSLAWFPVVDSSDRLQAVGVVVTDITERKRIEQTAMRQWSEIEALYAAGPVAMALVDADLRYLRINARMAGMHGRTVADSLGRKVPEILPGLWPQLEPSYRQVIERRQPVHDLEVRGVTDAQPGVERTWLASYDPVCDADGRFIGVSVFVMETTATKRAEEALRRSERIYRAIGESMDYGVWTATPDGRNTYASDSFLNLTGLTQKQCSDSGWTEVAHPDDVERAMAGWKDCIRAERPLDHEIRYRGTDGEWHPALCRGVPVRDEKGEIICWAGVNIDIGALKRTEHSLRESERRVQARVAELEAVMDAVPAALLITHDADAGHISGNRMACDLLRRPLGSNLSKSAPEGERPTNFRMLKDGVEVPPSELPIQKAAATGKPIRNCELEMIFEDGVTLNLLGDCVPMLDEDRQPRGAVGAFVDITGRKRAERQLKFQSDILETTAEAVLAVDPDFRVTFWNAGAERLYGVSKEEALGIPVSEVIRYRWLNPEEEAQCLVAFDQDGVWRGENIVVRPDGKRLFVRSTVNRIGPEHGGGRFAVIRDITESKQAEAVLRESEARERNRSAELEAIMAVVPAGVFIAQDAECRNITGNRMAYRMLSSPFGTNVSKSATEEVRPKTWREMKNGTELMADELPMQVAARTGEAVHDYEFELLFDDGAVRTWLGNAVPTLGEDGSPRGAVGAFVDITERKRAEERLRQTQKLESIGMLAGGIAHDFNNILVGVIGNASLAQDMLPGEDPVAGLMVDVINAGERAAHLTRQMLAYAGKGRYYLQSVNLSKLVAEVESLARPSIPRKVALHLDLEPALPAIEADSGQVQQAFLNLVLNAAEAIGDETGVIYVRTGVQWMNGRQSAHDFEIGDFRPGKYVYLEVRDTGCGMDSDTKAKIFDPFFSTKFTGRGLGLAAVGGIVRVHKGAVKVASQPGSGSCFTIYFPVAEQSPPPPVAPPEAAAEKGFATVLVVDDEEAVREIAKKALERRGYKVLSAASGLEAIDVYSRHRGDLAMVLLDLSMPGMSGQEALPELHKIRADVPIVVSSGYSEEETMRLFGGQRVSGFLQKPYTATRLAELVAGTLKKAE